MDTGKIRMLKFFEKHKGEHILNHDKVYRFLAIGEDDHDLYYMLWDGRKITWTTGVDRLTLLKGKIDEYDYIEMIRMAKINHLDQPDYYMPRTTQDKIKVLHGNAAAKAEAEKLTLSEKFLTDFCWDLN